MVLLELLLRPLPDDVVARVEAFADALGVGDDCREVVAATRHLAAGATDMALADFMRNGYEVLHLERAGEEPPEDVSSYWAPAHDDPGLAARWDAMQDGSPTSLGRCVWEFYKGRGFNFPGDAEQRPAPPGPARLRPRARRLRHDGGVRDRGVRPDRPGRRGPALVQPPGRRPRAVRGWLPGAGPGCVPGRPGPPQPRLVGHGHPARQRHRPGWRSGVAVPREPRHRPPGRRLARPGPRGARRPAPASSASTDPGPSPWRPKQPVRPARSNPAASPSPSSSGAGTWPGPRDGPTTPSGRRCRPVRPIRPTAQIDAGPVPLRRRRQPRAAPSRPRSSTSPAVS